MRTSIYFLALMLLYQFSTFGQEGKVFIPVQLFVEVGENQRLRLTLTNSSERTVSMFLSDLPWERTSSMTIFLVDPKMGSDARKQNVKQADLLPGTVDIKAHGFLQEWIDLNSRFPDVSRMLESRKVLLFWYFQPDLRDSSIAQEIQGGLCVLNRPREE